MWVDCLIVTVQNVRKKNRKNDKVKKTVLELNQIKNRSFMKC